MRCRNLSVTNFGKSGCDVEVIFAGNCPDSEKICFSCDSAAARRVSVAASVMSAGMPSAFIFARSAASGSDRQTRHDSRI